MFWRISLIVLGASLPLRAQAQRFSSVPSLDLSVPAVPVLPSAGALPALDLAPSLDLGLDAGLGPDLRLDLPQTLPGSENLNHFQQKIAPTLGDLPAERAARSLDRVFDAAGAYVQAPVAVPAAAPALVPSRFTPPSAAGAAAPQAPWVSFNGSRFRRWMFSDETKIAQQLERAIDRTEDTLDIAIYSFRFQNVADAIERAVARGVKVRMIFDEHHAFPRVSGSEVQGALGSEVSEQILAMLKNPKVDARILRGQDRFGSMHNKIAIFDGKMFVTGSFNWNENADDANWENTIWRAEPDRVALMQEYFDWMFAASSKYKPGQPPGTPADLGTPPEDAKRSVKFKRWWFPKAVFSPDGRAAWWVRKAIRSSERTIEVAMFSFYSVEIADELVKAHERGVKVRIVADASQATKNSQIPRLLQAGIEVRLTNGHTPSGWDRMHNKFGIFDGEMLQTGSFNWTYNADNNNFENANFLNDAEELAGFLYKWEQIWGSATKASLDRFDSLDIQEDGMFERFDGLSPRPVSDEDFGAGELPY